MGLERTSVGLDVHARSVSATAIDGVTGELIKQRLVPDQPRPNSLPRASGSGVDLPAGALEARPRVDGADEQLSPVDDGGTFPGGPTVTR